jgi:hypothetical protein
MKQQKNPNPPQHPNPGGGGPGNSDPGGPDDPDPKEPKKKNNGPSPEDIVNGVAVLEDELRKNKRSPTPQNTQNKTVEDILDTATFSNKTKKNSKIYTKSGNAFEDFNSLGLNDVRDIDHGKLGRLDDGRMVNVRTKSQDGRVTLEIINGAKRTKIRYVP